MAAKTVISPITVAVLGRGTNAATILWSSAKHLRHGLVFDCKLAVSLDALAECSYPNYLRKFIK
jgi:hypothetical protein